MQCTSRFAPVFVFVEPFLFTFLRSALGVAVLESADQDHLFEPAPTFVNKSGLTHDERTVVDQLNVVGKLILLQYPNFDLSHCLFSRLWSDKSSENGIAAWACVARFEIGDHCWVKSNSLSNGLSGKEGELAVLYGIRRT